MTKAEIVQRLLDKGQITAEEATVLLQENQRNSSQYYTEHEYDYPHWDYDRTDWTSTETKITYLED